MVLTLRYCSYLRGTAEGNKKRLSHYTAWFIAKNKENAIYLIQIFNIFKTMAEDVFNITLRLHISVCLKHLHVIKKS